MLHNLCHEQNLYLNCLCVFMVYFHAHFDMINHSTRKGSMRQEHIRGMGKQENIAIHEPWKQRRGRGRQVIVGWMRTKSNGQCVWNNNMKPSTDFLRPVECTSSSVHLAYHLKQVGLPDQLECQIPVLMTLTRYVNWRATEKYLNFEPFRISTLIHMYLCTHIHMNTCKTHRVVTRIRKWNENRQLFMYQLRKFWRTEPLTVSKKLYAEEENKYIRQGTNKRN